MNPSCRHSFPSGSQQLSIGSRREMTSSLQLHFWLCSQAFPKKGKSFWTKCLWRFYCHWLEKLGRIPIAILCRHLPTLSWSSHWPHLTGGLCQIWRCKGICASNIPYQQPAILPWDPCDAIRSLSIPPLSSWRFQPKWNFGCWKGTVNDVIK